MSKSEFLIAISKDNSNATKLLSADANLTNLENDYIFLNYNSAYRFLEYKNRGLYEFRLFKDMSNIVPYYDSNREIKEIGVLTEDDLYIPIYKKYNVTSISSEINELVSEASTYLFKQLTKNLKSNPLITIGLNYIYNNESLEISINYGTESDISNLNIFPEYSTCLCNYKNNILLCPNIVERIKTLISSCHADNLYPDYEIVASTITKIDYNLKNYIFNSNIIKSSNIVYNEIQELY